VALKKFLVAAIFGLAGLAAFAGTCVVRNVALTSIDGKDVFAGELRNDSGVNILQHNFVVAFLDSSNNVVETKTVAGCLRSVQNGTSDFFSVKSTEPDSTTSTGLARIAFDSVFKVGATETGSVDFDDIVVARDGETLTVTGKVTNRDGDKLVDPAVCIVVKDDGGHIVITKKDETITDLDEDENDTFSVEITVPDSTSTIDSVDIYVDGLDGSSSAAPIDPESDLDNSVTLGGGDHLAFTVQPADRTGGQNFASSIKVAIQDSSDDTVTSATNEITLAVKSGTGTAGAVVTCDDNSVAAVSGIATFANCSVDKVGTDYKLRATATGLTAADSSAFDVTLGAAAKVIFTTQPSASSVSDTAFATQPIAKITDLGGNVITTDSTSSVTLAIFTNPGAGTPTCTSTLTVTVALGVATFTGCEIDMAGVGYVLMASSGALTTGLSSAFTITPGAAAKLAINEPADGATPLTLAPQPVVTVQDAAGNTVTGSTASIALTVQQIASGPTTLACTQPSNTLAATAGVATFSGCVLTGAGTVTITAASSGLTDAVTTNIVVS
jgi:hypothetical protein